MAENNLAKEPQLIEQRSRMNDLSAEAKTYCESVQEKQAQISKFSHNSSNILFYPCSMPILESLSGNINPETTLALLQTAAAESEETSEKLSTDFLESSLPVEEFTQQFLKDRKEMHLRKLKAEKMVELLRQPRRASSNLPPAHQNYGPQSNFYPSSNTPYPSGPISMPMPGYPY